MKTYLPQNRLHKHTALLVRAIDRCCEEGRIQNYVSLRVATPSSLEAFASLSRGGSLLGRGRYRYVMADTNTEEFRDALFQLAEEAQS